MTTHHHPQSAPFDPVIHRVDVCVIGAGMAGISAALASARHGAQVVLIHDRPVPGGNASSEIRMHICGADRHHAFPNLRETGILEELRLESLRHNPDKNYSVWDLILFDKLKNQPNLTVLLNTTCLEATMHDDRIRMVRARQLTTETDHHVGASIFIDCSGEGVLAPLTGANFRMGREARAEFNESIAPHVADQRTMGMTCMFQARRHDTPRPFEPPPWAEKFETCEDLPYGMKGHSWLEMGYWWIELGGENHSIRDTESIRDELLRIVLGVWDHLKNRCSHDAANWALEWIQFLPGKRESRRYEGDHILTQNDITSEGRFEDIVAYGGWSMDDHHPAGFRAVRLGQPATLFHPAPSPYGIPYRSLYSRNINNLMFAGRCASCTHAAMSSTRVAGTAAVMGQAAGTAAALAVSRGLSPREMNTHITLLQQTLLKDDAYLPWIPLEVSELTRTAHLEASHGDPERVRDGVHRPVGDNPHCWTARPGDHLTYTWETPVTVREATLILDSGLDQLITMSHHQHDNALSALPDKLPCAIRVEGRREGHWLILCENNNQHQRMVRIPVGMPINGLRFIPLSTWGNAESTRVFAFYAD